ncbi:hypothetical protein [Halogeometricum rufum]|uniref:hypothetical protein n=1 Tax=Halogeometricum rufum TaxID=553469 RepID=UPI0011608F7D|nr:hypothetical protein [Halogeometricum rufum]
MSGCSKEDKKDGAMRALYEHLDGVDPVDLLPEQFRESRRLVQVTLEGSGDLSEEERRRSEGYWQQASIYGLVDSCIRPPEGDTIMILSVTDEDEAQQLVRSDPTVSDGDVELGRTKLLFEE